ncbi:hypothetical protein UFOVP736_56 [uncultured Caudovirales phage]|uniref:Uncharacterized protein n=1 Tax=uncultured Caudovirales phage TaxID=2100421 RepID=A0A6J7X1I9_9CAUD|nr:hypothetical protein UFOVP705_25 [uncultured Caudovirales phage]CAB5224329.1 hypothetical protein UFOVP736_56 [uncultured Caudovirales phage]
MTLSTLLDKHFPSTGPNADFDEGAWIVDRAKNIYLWLHMGEEVYYKTQLGTSADGEQTYTDLARYENQIEIIDEYKLIPWSIMTTQQRECYQCRGRIFYGESYADIPRSSSHQFTMNMCRDCYNLTMSHHAKGNFIEKLATYDRDDKSIPELTELCKIAKQRRAYHFHIAEIEKEIAKKVATTLNPSIY